MERLLSHGISELASLPPAAFLELVMKDEDAGLAMVDEDGLGLYEAHGLGWYDEQRLADAEAPTISMRSTGLQP